MAASTPVTATDVSTAAIVSGRKKWWLPAMKRAHASLRTTLWRSRVDGHELVRPIGAHLCLADNVHVDLPDAVDRARRLLRRASACDGRELDWLTGKLATDGNKWKVTFFHHPPFSSGGRHGSDEKMREFKT